MASGKLYVIKVAFDPTNVNVDDLVYKIHYLVDEAADAHKNGDDCALAFISSHPLGSES